jgi:cell wall-associated NlpC family hydrolase
VVGAMNAALDRRTAAEHAQQAALARQNTLTARVAADKSAADRALGSAQSALRGLQHDLAATKQSRLAAVAALSQFLGGWSLADPTDAAALNAHYRQIAAQAAKVPRPGNPGHWTPALGAYAAARALAWIGTPYAWAGGDAAGPTRGVCAGDGAQHDCQVVGFDCSGLALYAWAPFLGLPHLAATQYSVAGSVHPAVRDLLPGDLVFWSDGGTAGGIHHVAIYLGNGNVVQAPQSGDIVRVTPLTSVDSGYFGATRPLS